MVARFVQRFGRIDILVNNPYRWQESHFLDISEADWDSTMGVCLKSYFLCSQSAARVMVDQGDGGSIVSTSSVHAKRVWPGDTTYGIAKAGILRARPDHPLGVAIRIALLLCLMRFERIEVDESRCRFAQG